MARHKTPTAIKELTGSAKKNPQRVNKNELKDDRPLRDPPGYFNETQAAAWHDIADSAVPGVLKKTDSITLEIAAKVLAGFRDPDGEQAAADRTLLVSLLAKFGMTPADRAKIDMGGGEDPEDVWGDFE